MNATDLIVKYAKSNLNPTDYDKAIKTLNKKRPEQREIFFFLLYRRNHTKSS